MIIGDDSPLRKVPAALNQPQQMFIDAIRYSIEMSDLANRRLSATLFEIATDRENNALKQLRVSALSDAWSVVDSAFRLRCLIEAMPNLKKKSPGIQLFLRQTTVVRNLRNVVQHLDTEMKNLIAERIGAWGALSWATVIDKDNCLIRTCIIIPGKMFDNQDYDFLNPAGRHFTGVVDHITLKSGKYALGLSDVMRSIEKLTAGLEKSLEPQVKGQPAQVGELLISADIDFSGKGT